MKSKSISERLAPVLCNLVTFVVVFIVITAFADGVPDIIWISLRIVAAVAIAIWFGTKYPSMKAIEVFLWSIVQDFVAYIFRRQIAGILGVSTASALWEFEYIGLVYVWITALAIIQPLAIVVKRKLIDKNI